MSTPTEQPTVLWEPTEELVERATITRFARWVAETRDVDVAGDYHALWRWSVEDVEGFWAAIWEFFDVQSETGYEKVLGSREMPGAEWFRGATVSYARHIFRGREDGDVGDRVEAVEVLAAVAVAVHGEHHLGLDLGEAVDDAGDAEVGRARRPRGADRGGGEKADQRLWRVGHVGDHAVAAPDAERAQALGDGRHLLAQLAPGELAQLA